MRIQFQDLFRAALMGFADFIRVVECRIEACCVSRYCQI